MTNNVAIKLLREGATAPTYGSAEAAGADLYACLESPVTIEAGETAMIPTGVAMAIPQGLVGLVYARSGLATKRGLAPANKVGVIDSDYRGEIFVALHNHGGAAQTVEHGERVAQLVLTPYVAAQFQAVESLDDTARGAGGFGSTGK